MEEYSPDLSAVISERLEASFKSIEIGKSYSLSECLIKELKSLTPWLNQEYKIKDILDHGRATFF